MIPTLTYSKLKDKDNDSGRVEFYAIDPDVRDNSTHSDMLIWLSLLHFKAYPINPTMFLGHLFESTNGVDIKEL